MYFRPMAFKVPSIIILMLLLLITLIACKSASTPTLTPDADWWDIPYRVTEGQALLRYSPAGINPFDKTIQFSEAQTGCITMQISKTEINGAREIRINQSDWYLQTILIPDFMTGINMNLNITLAQDAIGTLYTGDGAGDVTMASTSAAGSTPVQLNVFGDGIQDPAGSMVVQTILKGQAETSIGQTLELPLSLVFTTGNTTSIISEPSQGKGMNGSILTSNGTVFSENGGPAPYAGTSGTITATGTGDCLGIIMAGLSIDFQMEIKLVLEPSAACEAALPPTSTPEATASPGRTLTPVPTLAPNSSVLWFSTVSGVSRYDGSTWTTYNTSNSGLVSDYVQAITIDSAGNKWFSTDSGVSRFDGTDWTTFNTSNSGLAGDWISTMTIDKLGNIWFGTVSGLSKYDGKKWTTYNTSNSGLIEDCVTAIAIDSMGNMWFGTVPGSLSKCDGTDWTGYSFSDMGIDEYVESYDIIASIGIDNAGNKWCGTNFGVIKYDGTGWTIYNPENSGLAGYAVRTIVVDSEDNVWFCTWHHFGALGFATGVSKYNGADWITYNNSNSGLVSNYVFDMATDSYDNKWFGTDSGISKYNGVNWATYNTSNSGLANDFVYAIAIEDAGIE